MAVRYDTVGGKNQGAEHGNGTVGAGTGAGRSIGRNVHRMSSSSSASTPSSSRRGTAAGASGGSSPPRTTSTRTHHTHTPTHTHASLSPWTLARFLHLRIFHLALRRLKMLFDPRTRNGGAVRRLAPAFMLAFVLAFIIFPWFGAPHTRKLLAGASASSSLRVAVYEPTPYHGGESVAVVAKLTCYQRCSAQCLPSSCRWGSTLRFTVRAGLTVCR